MAHIQFSHSRAFPANVDPLKAGEINGEWFLQEGQTGVALNLSGFRSRIVGFQPGSSLAQHLVATPGHVASDSAAMVECGADGEDWTELAEIDTSNPHVLPPADKPWVRARGLRGVYRVELTARNDRVG
jgi:hypothetical protein